MPVCCLFVPECCLLVHTVLGHSLQSLSWLQESLPQKQLPAGLQKRPALWWAEMLEHALLSCLLLWRHVLADPQGMPAFRDSRGGCQPGHSSQVKAECVAGRVLL
jgi:hypothetical protein